MAIFHCYVQLPEGIPLLTINPASSTIGFATQSTHGPFQKSVRVRELLDSADEQKRHELMQAVAMATGDWGLGKGESSQNGLYSGLMGFIVV